MRQKKCVTGGADRGYILVFVLGVLMTIGLLLSDVSRRSHLGGSILLNSVGKMEKRSIAEGGVEIGIAALRRHLAEGHSRSSLPPFETQLGESRIAIEVEDECGKLNLRTADTGTMERLFSEAGFDRQTSNEMSLSILHQRGGKATGKSSGPGSLEELYSLDGFDASMMRDLGRLVTTHCPRKSVSVWTAPVEVLHSLPGADRNSIDRFVNARASRESAERGQRLNLYQLSKKAGWLSESVGPIYTVRSSVVNNGKKEFTQEQLVFVGGSDIGKKMVLRTTFPRNQEIQE